MLPLDFPWIVLEREANAGIWEWVWKGREMSERDFAPSDVEPAASVSQREWQWRLGGGVGEFEVLGSE